MMKFATTLVFLMTVAPASAKCPFNEAEDGVIALTHASPYLSVTYKKSKDGLVERKITKPGKNPKTIISVYSHPLLVVKRTAGDEVLQLMYSRNFEDLNRLPDYKRWSSDVELVVNGKKEAQGTESLEFERRSQLSIGECQYEVWKIHEMLSIDGKNPIFDTKYYSPKLNIVLRVTLIAPNGQVIADTTYDKIRLLQK